MFSLPPPPPTGPQAKGGISPAEKGRLVILTVLTLVVAAGTVAWFVSGNAVVATRDGATPADAEGGPPAAPTDDKDPRIVPLFPEDEAELAVSAVRNGLAELPPIIDGAPAIDPEPWEFLIGQVSGNFRIINLKPEVFETGVDRAGILEDPGSHRGRLLRVTGELLSIERVPYKGKHEIVKELRRGVVRTVEGEFYTFTEPVSSAFGAAAEVPADGWVRLHGLFYKTWRVDEAPGGGEGGMSLHLFLQRPPVRDYPPVTITDIDTSWLEELEDETPAQMNQRDREPLFYLLNMAKTLGPGGFDAWLAEQQKAFPDRKIHPPEEFASRSRELMDAPDLHRFRPVTYTGYLARPGWVPDLKPNCGNIEKLYLGFLVADDFVPVWVYSHRSFVEMGFKADDRVRMRGLFYMRTSYMPRGGGEMLMAPIFVAFDLEKLPPVQTGGLATDLLLTIVTFMVLLLGLLGYALWQSRQEAGVAETRRLKQLERRRARRAAAGDPAGVPPSGEGGADA